MRKTFKCEKAKKVRQRDPSVFFSSIIASCFNKRCVVQPPRSPRFLSQKAAVSEDGEW